MRERAQGYVDIVISKTALAVIELHDAICDVTTFAKGFVIELFKPLPYDPKDRIEPTIPLGMNRADVMDGKVAAALDAQDVRRRTSRARVTRMVDRMFAAKNPRPLKNNVVFNPGGQTFRIID